VHAQLAPMALDQIRERGGVGDGRRTRYRRSLTIERRRRATRRLKWRKPGMGEPT
jgi:hypothetical protein